MSNVQRGQKYLNDLLILNHELIASRFKLLRCYG